ncbi:hypothetical protein ABNavy71_233 [Acinetobacter phage AB-Navy71]|nr:hypothetical protein CPT_Maestro_242 [Acinetobacter phage Maestro]QQM18722.1 hypothetical protein CPT_Morttis_236 [Acinetobacter phage Morttis]QQO96926.1 hypothetical protein CPT_Melin_234 [Acinetobacter phage Melin]UQS94302.1 hypothetical protein ABNavy71_233 [Acinetobacter phage AB-Navy71]
MLPAEMRLWRKSEVCRVVNKYSSEYDINIQRGTIWGNPFTVEEHGNQAIPLFKAYFINLIKDGKITRNHLEVLRGQRLGCTCKPKACHGDIIATVVNKLFKDEFSIEDL